MVLSFYFSVCNASRCVRGILLFLSQFVKKNAFTMKKKLKKIKLTLMAIIIKPKNNNKIARKIDEIESKLF